MIGDRWKHNRGQRPLPHKLNHISGKLNTLYAKRVNETDLLPITDH